MAGTSITLGLSMILAVLMFKRGQNCKHANVKSVMINSPVALLDDPDDPSLVALHLLNVLAVGSGLLHGNIERQSFS